MNGDKQENGQPTPLNHDGAMIRKNRSIPIEETALAEAREIAEAAAKISMAALDVGNQLVDQAEQHNIALEDAVSWFRSLTAA